MCHVPLHALVLPVVVPLGTFRRRNEELQLHLLELSRTKDEVAGGDLITETLSHLRDAEWGFLAAGGEHIGEVHEHALGGLGPQIHLGARPLDRPGVGLEHQVERARLGECAAFHLLGAVTRVELVLSETTLADRAIHEWVTEVRQVSAGLERLRRVQDCRVDQHHVVSCLHHGSNPCVLHVAQHERTERTVVVRRSKATVDFGARKRKTPALGQVDDVVEILGRHWIQASSGVAYGCGASKSDDERIRRSR